VKAVHPVRQKTTPKAQQNEKREVTRLEDEGGALGLLVTTELEVLASLEGKLQCVSSGLVWC
jgi:hypothetical protein